MPAGFLWPFVEGNRKVFQCPEGDDRTPGPTFGQRLQVSYALNYVSDGPTGLALVHIRPGTSQVLLAWDHSNVPACAYQSVGTPRVPWPFDHAEVARHYPMRHTGTFNLLYCDGHVTALTFADLWELYLATLDEAITQATDGDWLVLEIDRLSQLVAPAAYADEHKPFANAEFDEAVAFMRAFAVDRPRFVASEIARQRAARPGPLPRPATAER